MAAVVKAVAWVEGTEATLFALHEDGTLLALRLPLQYRLLGRRSSRCLLAYNQAILDIG
jgi:hypothetical protein